MKRLPVKNTTRIGALLLLLLASAALTGCLIRSYGNTGRNATGNNTTGSNFTGSNATFGGRNSTVPRSSGSSSSDTEILRNQVALADDKREEKSDDPPKKSGTDAPGEAANNDAATIDPLDWPYWHGPEYNGISRETGLPDRFNPRGGPGSNVRWKRDDLGGRGTPIVMNGKLYLMLRDEPGTKVEGEKVVCLNFDTGETIWENKFNVWSSDVPDTRVGWSAVVGDPETGNVYALGVCDYFQCIDGETGETKWSVPLHERFGFLSTYGGRTNFPVICDDLVIISAIVIGWGDMAKPAHRFVAFDKRTGEVVWFTSTRLLPYDTTYSGPSLAVLNGQKALVFGSGDGAVWAIQPRTGQRIWKYQFSRRGLDCAPVVIGDQVFCGHSQENIAGVAMGAVARIDGKQTGDLTKKGQVWKVEEVMMGKSSPVVVEGRIYCGDDYGKLYVLDAETGKQIGRKLSLGSALRSSLLYADGKIYAMERSGRWFVLKPDETRGVTMLNRGRLPSGDEFLASPIVSHGRLVLQTTGCLYCLEDTEKEHGVTPRPETAEETPVAEDPEPAHVQIVPAEVLTRPGSFISFRVRLFNSHGQFLREVEKAEFAVEGGGEIAEDGSYLAPAGADHQAKVITAKVGDLEGKARMRIVPDLPWSFSFDGLDNPPITWVGARYRHVLREIDDNTVMVKVNTIPKGTRSRCWFGHSDLSNYTIQADVRGSINNKKMPDIGLIAQGYTFDLMGASQQIQIRSWVPHDKRTHKTLPFKWTPDTWYTMKFRAGIEDGNAVLKGKVWPRGEAEPEGWTIEIADSRPNEHGSPGLFGNAKDAELYLDNITVTPNGG